MLYGSVCTRDAPGQAGQEARAGRRAAFERLKSDSADPHIGINHHFCAAFAIIIGIIAISELQVMSLQMGVLMSRA